MVFIRELGECTNVFTVSIPNMSKKEGDDRDDKNQPCTCITRIFGGYSWEFLVGVCRPVLQILILYQTKICHFSHPFSNLASKKLFHHNLVQNRKKRYSHISLSFLIIWNCNDKLCKGKFKRLLAVYSFKKLPIQKDTLLYTPSQDPENPEKIFLGDRPLPYLKVWTRLWILF